MRVRINIIAQFISCMMISGVAFAATGIMSKYGTIQGVDGYSTNPFGSSKTYSYSNRMPVPVYENGPDVKTDECLSIVSNMVANTCANMQNCTNASLSDIRPGIILQLSRMSGGNYATACAGYMDEAFRQYKQSHAHLPQNGNTSFPAATAPTQPTNTNKSAIPLNNFFETQKPAWAIEMQERATELAEFQADNDKFYSELEPTAFPTTYADLSFSERMANNKAGYEPYQGKSAFKPIDIESLEDYNKRMNTANEEYRKRCRNLLDELIRKLQNATSEKCKEILKQLKDIDNVHNWQDNCEKNTADALKKLEALKQAAIDNGCFNTQSGGQQNSNSGNQQTSGNQQNQNFTVFERNASGLLKMRDVPPYMLEGERKLQESLKELGNLIQSNQQDKQQKMQDTPPYMQEGERKLQESFKGLGNLIQSNQQNNSLQTNTTIQYDPEINYNIPSPEHYILITGNKYELPYDVVSHTTMENFTECIKAIQQEAPHYTIDQTGKLTPDFPTKQQANDFISGMCDIGTYNNIYNNCCKGKYLYIVNTKKNTTDTVLHYE